MAEDPKIVMDKLESLRVQLVRSQNAIGYMATNIQSLSDRYGERAAGVWIDFFGTVVGDEENLLQPIIVRRANEYIKEDPKIRYAIAGEDLYIHPESLYSSIPALALWSALQSLKNPK